MKLIWKYLRKYKLECVVAPLFKLLEACFDLCVPLVVASIVDGGIEAGDVGYIWRMFGLLVLLSVVGLSCTLVAQFFAARAAVGSAASLRHDLFDADAVVLKNAPRQVTLETADDPRSVTVTYPQMPYIGFWHKPKSDAPYVCIEPWLSLPASLGKTTVLEEHSDLVALAPNKLWTAQMIIEIH